MPVGSGAGVVGAMGAVARGTPVARTAGRMLEGTDLVAGALVVGDVAGAVAGLATGAGAGVGEALGVAVAGRGVAAGFSGSVGPWARDDGLPVGLGSW